MSFLNPDSRYSLTETKASELIGVSPRTLRRYRENGVAPKYLKTPTQRVKYSMNDVTNWIEQQVKKGKMQDLRDGWIVSKQALTQGGNVQKFKDIVDENLAQMNEKARNLLTPKTISD